jgi:hypothetical protein
MTERRLRRALIGVSMFAALCVLAVAGVLWYWHAYLLGPSGEPFTRGPYLIRVDEQSAKLAWRVKDHARVELVATAPDARSFTATDGVFRGLQPGTRYAWTASVGGIGRAAGSFRTAPQDPATPIRLVAFGDYGSGNDHAYAVGRVAAAQDPALMVTAGDNSYLVAAPALLDRNIFRPLRPLLANADPVIDLGDHDVFLSGGQSIIDAFELPGERFTVAYGPLQIVVLGVQAGADDVSYLQQALARPGFTHRIVVVHKPLQEGNPVLPVLAAGRVDVVLSGHLHRYERRIVGGLLTFTVGTGGMGPGQAEFTKPSPGAQVSLLDYGFLRIDIEGPHIRYAFIDERGRVIDQAAR